MDLCIDRRRRLKRHPLRVKHKQAGAEDLSQRRETFLLLDTKFTLGSNKGGHIS